MAVREKTFGLVGDGDDVDLLEAIEKLFDIEIENSEAERIITLGDLLELVIAKAPSGRECLVSKKFRVFRDAMPVPSEIRPDTPIADLVPDDDAVRSLKDLSARTGLNLSVTCQSAPVLGIRWGDWCVGLAALVGLTINYITGSEGWTLASSLAVLLLSATFPPRTHLTRNVETVSDLLRASLFQNLPSAPEQTRAGNRADYRHILIGLCRDFGGYEGPVTDRTRII